MNIKIDSSAIRDSIKRANANRADSIMFVEARLKIQNIQTLIASHPYFRPTNRSLVLPMHSKEPKSQDVLFYVLTGIVLYFALIRLFFGRYLDNLVTLFFRVTMRQQQIREQLLQTPLASLLLNILFVLTAGMYLAFLAFHFKISPTTNFWLVFAYCTLFVALLYLGKFVLLKTAGWIFGVTAATDTYIFVVFLVNKMIGMLLLPIVILMAFPHSGLYPVALVLSYVMLILLFLYRFFISYRPISNEIKVNKFHFFIYLCAFEIAPLLLIYKVLLNFVERST